jgi:hypothetical protein
MVQTQQTGYSIYPRYHWVRLFGPNDDCESEQPILVGPRLNQRNLLYFDVPFRSVWSSGSEIYCAANPDSGKDLRIDFRTSERALAEKYGPKVMSEEPN